MIYFGEKLGYTKKLDGKGMEGKMGKHKGQERGNEERRAETQMEG